jgi:hypothetical protein
MCLDWQNKHLRLQPAVFESEFQHHSSRVLIEYSYATRKCEFKAMPFHAPCGLVSATLGIPLLILIAFILLPPNPIIGEQISVVPDEGPSGKNRTDTLQISAA